MSLERRAPQGVTYGVALTGPDRNAALAALQQLQTSVRDSYQAQTGRDLTTFTDPYVPPVITTPMRAAKTAVLSGLLALGLARVVVGARRSRPE